MNINLGGLLLEIGRTDEAIKLYEGALAINPNLPQLQFNLGKALEKKGDVPGAILRYVKAAELDPTLAPAYEGLGVLLPRRASPRGDRAVREALKIDPALVLARDNLGRALAQTGHLPEAIEQFRMVLLINPDDAQARENLARLQQFDMQRTAPGH